MVHMHITAWALGLILFFVAYSLYSAGRKGKGVHGASPNVYHHYCDRLHVVHEYCEDSNR